MVTGKYPGVYWHPKLKRWVVSITVFLGAFEDQDQAGAVQARLERRRGEIEKVVTRVAGTGSRVALLKGAG